MPLALVSDIHGSDDALAAVVAELERLGIERVICLGDAVQGGDQPRGGARPPRGARLAGRARERGRVPARGPDRLARAAHAGPARKREWTLAQLEPRHLEQIRSFAPTLDVELDDGLALRAFHGSPHSYDDVVLPETPDAQVEHLLGGSGVDVLAGGHTHMQWTR